MPYAQGRTYYDADSHLMELGDWLGRYADPDDPRRIRPLYLGGAGRAGRRGRRPTPRRAAATRTRRRRLEDAPDGREGMERARRLRPRRAQPRTRPARLRRAARVQHVRADAVLGRRPRAALRRHARAQPRHRRLLRRRRAPDRRRLRAAGAIPSWRARGRRRGDRPRLRRRPGPVGAAARPVPHAIPTSTPCGRALPGRRRAVHAARRRRRAARPRARSTTTAARSPTSSAAARTSAPRTTWRIHHPPEMFLAAMVLDGVLEQFPTLRGGCIEQGAMWVVPWLQRGSTSRRRPSGSTEPALATCRCKASEYVHRQLWFTPFPTEPVGWMIEQAATICSCSRPTTRTPRATRDPLGRFEASLAGVVERGEGPLLRRQLRRDDGSVTSDLTRPAGRRGHRGAGGRSGHATRGAGPAPDRRRRGCRTSRACPRRSRTASSSGRPRTGFSIAAVGEVGARELVADEVRRCGHRRGQLRQHGAQHAIGARTLGLAPVVLGGEVVGERLEIHRLVAADHDEASERRQRLGGEQLPRSHLRASPRIAGHEPGRRMSRLEPVHRDVRIADHLGVGDEDRRRRHPGPSLVVLLAGERNVGRAPVGQALQLEDPAQSLRPR